MIHTPKKETKSTEETHKNCTKKFRMQHKIRQTKDNKGKRTCKSTHKSVHTREHERTRTHAHNYKETTQIHKITH